MTVYCDGNAIRSAAPWTDWIDAMETAMKQADSGQFLLPKRMHLDWAENTFLIMPCVDCDYWMTKLVSFCPANADRGLPSLFGSVVLNSTRSGEPLAVMDGPALTAMRTAAVSAAGIRALCPVDVHRLGLVGAGVQGVFQALFACLVRDIQEIWVSDRQPENLVRFETELRRKHPRMIIHRAESREVVRNAQIVISATNAKSPVFPDEKDLFRGKTCIGIGSYKPDCREYPQGYFALLDQIFVDSMDGKSESGDLITPVQNGWFPGDGIHPLGQLLRGDLTLSGNETRFFKTVGNAVFDLFAARLVFEKGNIRQDAVHSGE